MMLRFPTLAGAGLLCTFLATSASAALSGPPSAIFAFGDSLNDTGNANILSGGALPAYPAPYDTVTRFSDGLIWLDGLAATLGLPINPSAGGGTNFAVGGAIASEVAGNGALNSDSTPFVGPGQVDLFLDAFGPVVPSDALYVINGGGNDIIAFNNTAIAVDNLIVAVNKLAAAGAENFLIANIPDVGLIPRLDGSGLEAIVTNLVTTINADLVNSLATEVPGSLNIMTVDFFSLVQDVVLNGVGSFGNVTDACTDGVTVCGNPSDYVFWDDIHPTTAVGALATDAALASLVPVPAAIWLFVPALAGLLRIGRRAA